MAAIVAGQQVGWQLGQMLMRFFVYFQGRAGCIWSRR
ncbi:hypothetical protein LRU_00885 [Ligilactobacillus ruminis SPM0211]|uniref:Uncharacterized protein n=1 Tax=Ligilactobacillus ruminis SPM0211 TaxID=1040964 RepID=F7QZM9_9LACO|nr:hypothetical protein LRU_00885 [Ligilactobacillus ruminis SPM0211]